MYRMTESSPPLVPSTFDWVQEPWGLLLRCLPLATAATHGWTTRMLALAGGNGRCEAAWRQLAASGGAERGAVRLVHQVHGASVVDASELDPARPPQADGLMSDASSVLLTIRVADCVPLLLADTRLGVVAAVHGGWRGTAAGIAEAAVERLVERYGSRPVDLRAALGPSIGPCCYTVGAEVIDAFRANGHDGGDLARWFVEGDGRIRLDLWGATRDRLIAVGVPAGSVYVSGLCTSCRPDWFFSYRREGAAAGRLAGFIRASGERRR
jgi:YfiH family protein